MDTLRPLDNRVLVHLKEREEKSSGGIIIPEDAAQLQTQYAKVIAVGPGKRTSDGKLIGMQVSVGDTIMFKRHYGVDLGNKHTLLQEDEILAIKD